MSADQSEACILTIDQSGAIQSTNILTESERVHPTDIPAFLKAEREEAILGLLEETKKETVESLTSRHWDAVVR